MILATRVIAVLTGCGNSAAPASAAFQTVRTVSDGLQFQQNEPGDDQLRRDNLGVGDIRDSTVNDHRGVQHQRTTTFGVFGELNIRNDESYVVLGLENETDREVATNDADGQFERTDDRAKRTIS